MTWKALRGVRRTLLIITASFPLACSDGGGSASTTGPSFPSGTTPATGSYQTSAASVAGGRCLVILHGKGGGGSATVTVPADGGDVTVVAPTGNADGWGGRQWVYFPDDRYEQARQVVEESIAGCERVIVDGFSNGASFAAKLFCRGETFEGRLVGVVVDDPVVDAAVDGCAPDPSVAVTLYWTGALADTAQPGWDCAESDWTCEGGTTIGIDAYAGALGAPVLDSPFDDHQRYVDAPELSRW